MERSHSSLQYLSMEPLNYLYKPEILKSKTNKDPTAVINLNRQKKSHTNPEPIKPDPVLKMIYCKVCQRSFSSEKALWGHKRCCKPKGNNVLFDSGDKTNALDSGWSATAKRGRKPDIDLNSPEFIAALILLDISRGKNDNVMVTSDDREKLEKPKTDEFQPLDCEHQMTQIKCGKEFECTTCGKSFPTHQALGGHRASHKKDVPTVNSSDLEVKFEEETEQKRLTGGDHVCEICGRRFLIGQALGGHKRKHWTGPAFSPVSRVKTSHVSQENRIQESDVRVQESEVLRKGSEVSQIRVFDLNEVARESRFF